MTVDFNNKSIYGNTTINFTAVRDAAEIVLDYQGIEIKKVWDENGKELYYDDSYYNASLGSAIYIPITNSKFIW